MLKSVWYKTIDKVKDEDWNNIFPKEILKSKSLFQLMEHTFSDIIKYHYLCVYHHVEVIAILPCFEYRLNLDAMSSHRTQTFIGSIRNKWKNFLSIKVFVIGSYIATVEEYIGIKEGLNKEQYNYIISQVKNKTKDLNCKITMLKEVPSYQMKRIQPIFKDFVFVDSLPNSYVPISERFRPYPSMLKKKHRQRFKRAKRDFVRNELHFDLISHFEDFSDIAFELYTNVLNKSNSKFEKLNLAFFQNIPKHFNNKSYLLLIRNKDGDIKLAELIFECNDKLIPIYLGIDYNYHDVKCLYINTIIKSIEIAEAKDLNYVVLGQNSYYPKTLSGALLERVHLGFYSYKTFYSIIINKFFKYLFPPFKNEGYFFYKNNAINSISEFCEKHNINMLPIQNRSTIK